MRVGINCANLSANTLDMSLNLKFAIAIGLYCSMASAFDVFGIRINVFALKLGNKQPV
ncbi:hypothetical protein A2U01_0089153, partial [Trifolium medium]|nr:hypothetical protein [Trifolium medium]